LGSGVALRGLIPYKPRLLAAAVAGSPFSKGSAHCARSLRSKAVMGARPDLFRSQNKGTDMALYEHLLIARQDISAQQVDALATHLKTIVEGEGGKVEKQEYWGLRGLAYRIKKNRKGHYSLLAIDAPAPAVKEMVHARVQQQLPGIVHELTEQIGTNIDQLVDVKLMVIRRFEAQPDLANRIFLDMGQKELTFIQNFGFFFGFALGIPVAAITHFLPYWWLLPILGVTVGWVTNWLALWMIYEPPDPRKVGPFLLQGLFVRRQAEVAEVYARIVSDEILTMKNFGEELLNGPSADRTRQMIEVAMAPAIDRATGPARGAVRVALGTDQYDRISRSFAAEPVDQMMTPLGDPEFNRDRSASMRKLITDRMREMKHRDFSDLLHDATKQDEWLLLLHGAVLGFAAGLIHLAIFG